MGICDSSLSKAEKYAIERSNSVDRQIKLSHMKNEQQVKLLLLGTGECGKSTIMKQMQILYTDGFTDVERNNYKVVVRRNVIQALHVLNTGRESFGIELRSPEAEEAAEDLMMIDHLSENFWNSEIVDITKTLWTDPGIQEAYKLRSKFQLESSASYMLGNVERIGRDDYDVTVQDILHARLRTTGIQEKKIMINGSDFRFFDVGGQRNERRKWIHCFDDVTAVIFITALSEYDQTLYEDHSQNRMLESLSVFEDTCNNPFFQDTAMILFLNKIDLLEDKLLVSKFSDFFEKYEGENTFDEVSQYIQQMFLERNQTDKVIYPHMTCATDTSHVEVVFGACKTTILQSNLQKLGIS